MDRVSRPMPFPLRLLALPLLPTVLASCAPHAQDTPRQPIFREIVVGSGQKIALDSPLASDVLPLLELQGGTKFRLREGTFSDAESISGELGPDGRVRSLLFAYTPGTSFDQTVSSYVADLGPPARRTGSSADSLQTTRWEDARTAFEVVRRGSRVGSALYDRALASP